MTANYSYARVNNDNSSSSGESVEFEMTSLRQNSQEQASFSDYGLQVQQPPRIRHRMTCTKSTVIALVVLVIIGILALTLTALLATGVVTPQSLGISETSVTPTPFVTCDEKHWRCKNGYECIPVGSICNAVEDCSDNSDEKGCEGGCQMSDNLYHHCSNGDCIKINWRCDREPDCLDGDDEIGCEKCDNSTQFTCNNYDCVALGSRCDGIYDCVDRSDEYSCFKYKGDTIEYTYNSSLIDVCYTSYTSTAAAAGRICALLGHRYEGAKSSPIPRDDNSALAANITVFPQESNSTGTFSLSADSSCRSAVHLECKACGESTKAIWSPYLVGGDAAVSISDWPWQVKLNIANKICGGTIVGESWVLTAAHCVSRYTASDVKVTYGSSKFSGDGGGHRSVKRIVLHTNFSENIYQDYFTTYSYDLALLEVARMAYSSSVQPVCLPTQDDVISDQTICYITGFGSIVVSPSNPVYPTDLQEAKTKVWEKAACAKEYKKAYGFDMPDEWLCAGYRTAGIDSCGGDSGGPLVCQMNRRWVLHGIVSWGSTCRQAMPSAYARVSVASDWIRQYTDS